MTTSLDPTTALLLDLLTRAAAAHGVHEEQDLGGVYDETWPQWYAEHMTRSLADSGYRLTPVGVRAVDDSIDTSTKRTEQ